MVFSEKLKKAMQDLSINQAQVVGLTGIGKSSISQYLSGKNVPTQERQKSIAVSLGLETDYFEQEDEPVLKLVKSNNAVIPQLKVLDAAKLMRKNQNTIRKGLQQGRFDWGYAIRTSENGWSYFINARRFAEIERIEIPSDLLI